HEYIIKGFAMDDERLKQIVTVYLDLAESRARNRTVMNMKDWDTFLVQFLELADYPILKDTGKISMLEAKIKAESEYDKYRVIQDKNYISDFDREISKIIKKKDDDGKE
ncbi:MAG: RhuM family protein, partial [Bacteroidota bacterium]